MFLIKSRKISFRIIVILVGITLTIWLHLPISAEMKGFDSPEAVFENIVQATSSKDFQMLCRSIAPDDMATTNMVMIAGGAMITAFAKMATDASSTANSSKKESNFQENEKKATDEITKLETNFNAILKKHNIEEIMTESGVKTPPKDEKEARENLAILFKDVNQCSLLEDLFAFFDNMPGGKKETSWRRPQCTELKALTIEDDTATAMCGAEKLSFRKFQNRWYINPDEARQNIAK